MIFVFCFVSPVWECVIYISCVDLNFFSSYSHVRCSFSLASTYIVCISLKKYWSLYKKQQPHTLGIYCFAASLSHHRSHSFARPCFCLGDIYTNTRNTARKSSIYVHTYVYIERLAHTLGYGHAQSSARRTVDHLMHVCILFEMCVVYGMYEEYCTHTDGAKRVVIMYATLPSTASSLGLLLLLLLYAFAPWSCVKFLRSVSLRFCCALFRR